MSKQPPTGASQDNIDDRSGDQGARLTAILDAFVDGIVTIDEHGNIETVNSGVVHLFGYRDHELVGQNVKILMPEPYRSEHDGYLARYLKTNESHIIGTGREASGRRKDGQIFPIDLSVSEMRIGGRRKFTGIIRDITDRKEAEERLRATEMALRQIHEITNRHERNSSAKLQALLRLGCERFRLPLGIISQVEGDRYEVIEVVSAAGSLSIGQVFPLGHTFCNETLRASGPLHFHDITENDLKTHPCHREFGLQAYIGIPIVIGDRVFGTINFSSSEPRTERFTTTDEEIVKLMAQWVGGEIWRQETSRTLQDTERQLWQSQKFEALGRLSGEIAHDFNNLLTGIKGCAEIALKRVVPDSRAVPFIEEIRDAAGRGTSLPSQLLAFSRTGTTQTAVCRPDQVITKAERVLLAAVGANIKLTVELNAPDVEAVCDAGQLEQVVMNLVLNARDAMSDGGLVSITTEVVSGPPNDTRHILMTVSDTGCGMDERTRLRIFEPFFTTKKEKGTGLGLSTCYGIIRRARGTIDVDSRPGRGASIIVRLPVRPTPNPSKT